MFDETVIIIFPMLKINCYKGLKHKDKCLEYDLDLNLKKT